MPMFASLEMVAFLKWIHHVKIHFMQANKFMQCCSTSGNSVVLRLFKQPLARSNEIQVTMMVIDKQPLSTTTAHASKLSRSSSHEGLLYT